jgi:group I intron endonuclease
LFTKKVNNALNGKASNLAPEQLEKMPDRKFNKSSINVIRNMNLLGVSYRSIAKKYSTSISVIASIIRNKTYKDVPFEKVDLDCAHLIKIKRAKVLKQYHKIEINGTVDDMASGVYIIRNKINNKCYVGSSVNIRARLNWHYNILLKGKHPNNHLQSSFNLYLKENFEFIPLLNCPSNYNTKLEQWVKDKSNFKCDYNIAKNCEAPMLGVKMSEKTKESLRIKATNRKHTDKTKKMLSIIKVERIKSDIVYRNKILANIIINPRGESNPNSKLTEKDVVEIKIKFKNGIKVRDLVGKYDCSRNMLYEIKNGHNWKHILA